MESVRLSLVFYATTCKSCPRHKTLPDPEPNDPWGLSGFAVVCTELPNDTRSCGARSRPIEKGAHRIVEMGVRGYDPPGSIPAWCPLREENQTLADLDVERLWTRPDEFLDKTLHKLGISRRRFDMSLPTKTVGNELLLREHSRLFAELLDVALGKNWKALQIRTWLLDPHPRLGGAPIDLIGIRIAEVRALLQGQDLPVKPPLAGSPSEV